MTLPAQIQQQIDEAQSIIEQHYGPEDGAVTEEGQATEQAEQAAPVESVQEAPAQPPGNQLEDENSETYAQRWKSLQGIYNATVAKATSAETRVSQLEQLIAAMQTTPAVVPQHRPEPAAISSEDTEAFGDDLVGMVNRVAGSAVSSALSPMMQTLQALERQVSRLNGVVPVVQNVAAQQRYSREERFFVNLGEAVPDWEQVNANPRFHQWLLSADPLTGITRQTYLADAQSTFDVGRTVSIFNAWKGATGANPQPQVTAKASTAASELERQVAPGRTLSAAPTSSVQAKQWTTGEIAKYYDDVRRGTFKGREAERQSLERDIFDAQREGRITRSAA